MTEPDPELRLGDSGEQVVELQVRLYRIGLHQQMPDGTFDQVTEDSLRALQSWLGHENDGMTDPQTWEGIRYLEQQYGLRYEYSSPYMALDQLRYDLEHADDATGDAWNDDVRSDDGQTDAAASSDGYVGQLSEDGNWRWDGYQWQPVQADDAGQSGESAPLDDYVGQLSEDGYWRWDGYAWQPAS